VHVKSSFAERLRLQCCFCREALGWASSKGAQVEVWDERLMMLRGGEAGMQGHAALTTPRKGERKFTTKNYRTKSRKNKEKQTLCAETETHKKGIQFF
jgi:hypothetical protein